MLVRKMLAAAALLLILETGARPSLAWGPDGHRIVADIAAHSLEAPTRSAVERLLQTPSIVAVATWADEVRDSEEYAASSPLHYVNLEPGSGGFVSESDCPEGRCVVEAIRLYRDVLYEAAAAPSAKAEALRFLIHFVGDIHNPLHVSHAADRGGNEIAVVFYGRPTDLHWVWDFGLLERRARSWPKLSGRLRRSISSEEEARWTSEMNPARWADETYALAVEHAYAIPADHRLGKAYFRRNIPVVEQQLTKAGLRLAAMLNAWGEGWMSPGARRAD